MDIITWLYNAYVGLILAPEALHSFPDYSARIALLVIPSLIVLYLAALILKARLIQSRESLGAAVSVHLAWAWSAVCLAIILLLNLIVLWILGRLPDWTSATPQASIALLAIVIVAFFGNYRVLSGKLKAMQHIVFQAR